MLDLSSCWYLSSVNISDLLKMSLFSFQYFYSPADMSQLSILLLSCCYCSSPYISLLLPILLLSCWYLCSPADISVVVTIFQVCWCLRSQICWIVMSVNTAFFFRGEGFKFLLLSSLFLFSTFSSAFCCCLAQWSSGSPECWCQCRLVLQTCSTWFCVMLTVPLTMLWAECCF